MRQRVYGIACGYADCNDSARLAEDPVHKLLLERDPLAGPALASQPTLSRFENAVGWQGLYLASVALADLVIEHHRARLQGRARRITIDLDPTDDPTHGQQEFTFFNGHYDTWCYLPLVATLTFNAEPTQYLVAAVLRPGNSPAKRGAIGLLTRLCRRLRAAFPRARLRIRLDGGFASPEVLDFLEAEGVEYVVAMASNARLVKRSRRLMGRARMLSKASGADRAPLRRDPVRGPQVAPQAPGDHQGRGGAASRARARRTTRASWSPTSPTRRSAVYQIYCGRGDMENRLKELHHGLAMDRTSCQRFLANQFRVLLTAAAYILFQTLQAHAQGTACADAQVSTLRERLIKLAAWVERSVRRIVLHLPTTYPWLTTWRQIAVARRRGPGLVPAPPAVASPSRERCLPGDLREPAVNASRRRESRLASISSPRDHSTASPTWRSRALRTLCFASRAFTHKAG